MGIDAFDVGQFKGIPAMFVVDSDGTVQEFILGYGRGDTSLERALDALLAPPSP